MGIKSVWHNLIHSLTNICCNCVSWYFCLQRWHEIPDPSPLPWLYWNSWPFSSPMSLLKFLTLLLSHDSIDTETREDAGTASPQILLCDIQFTSNILPAYVNAQISCHSKSEWPWTWYFKDTQGPIWCTIFPCVTFYCWSVQAYALLLRLSDTGSNLTLRFEGQKRYTLMTHFYSPQVISYQCLTVICCITRLLYEIWAFNTWVTLTVNFQYYSRSNIIAILCLIVTYVLTRLLYELWEVKNTWPWIWPFKFIQDQI